MGTRIHPVILCGGVGSRLWPLSRESFPKQFGQLTGPLSLFQQCAGRLRGEGFAPPVVVTAAGFRFIVAEQLDAIGVEPAEILLEPEPRDTAPAVLAAALRVVALDPEGMVLIAPSDHHIPDIEAFRDAVRAGLPVAEADGIVTFGIRPDRAETGYGYLELAEPPGDGPAPLRRFVEKPEADAAAEMAASGRHLWNAGLFLARARDLVAAYRRHAPDLLVPVEAAVEGMRVDLGFLRLEAGPWSEARAISLDYAVMERAEGLSVVPLACEWSDLGDWDAIWRGSARDSAGVAASAGVTALDCRDSLLRVQGDAGIELVGIGLEDMVVVAMPDAVVVAPRARAQEVRAAVGRLKGEGRRQATAFARDHRPWGWFETVAEGHRHQVKRIVVRPGGVLSLQSHMHRAEHWIVVSGTARVTIGESVRLVSENESVYVPLGAVHRLENPGKVDLHVIEVQTGAYLGEDDIIRHADAYSRLAAD